VGTKVYKLFSDNLLIFIAALITVVFWQPFFDPFGPAQLMMLRIFVPLAFLFFFLSVAAEKKETAVKINGVVIFLFLYLLTCAFSVFFAFNKEISIKYVCELGLAIAGGWLICERYGRKGIDKVFAVLIVFHTLIAGYGVMQHFESDIFRWSTNFAGRPMGTIGNPDFFAGELLVSIFLTAAYILFGKKYKIPLIISAVIQILCFYYAKVAGAYIGFAAGAAVIFIIAFVRFKPSKKVAAAVIAAFIVLSAAAAPFIISKSGRFIEEKKHSMTDRMLMWKASLLMFKDVPVTGLGFGNYRIYYPKYQGELLNAPENNKYDYVVTWMPHQNYLLIMAETGLIGILLFLASVLAAVLYLFKSIKAGINPVNAGAISVIAALLAASFFNTFYNVPSTTLYFFMLLMLAGYAGNGSKILRLKKGASAAICAVSAAVLLYCAVNDGKTALSAVYLKKANSLTRQKMYGEAISMHERIEKLKPVELCPQTDVAQFYYAAETYREAGMLQKAFEFYGRDLAVNPYCPEVNNMYGALGGQLGNVDLAIKHLNTAIFTAPHYETAYTNLATAYMVKGDAPSAKKILQRYVEKNSVNPRVENMLKALGN